MVSFDAKGCNVILDILGVKEGKGLFLLGDNGVKNPAYPGFEAYSPNFTCELWTAALRRGAYVHIEMMPQGPLKEGDMDPILNQFEDLQPDILAGTYSKPPAEVWKTWSDPNIGLYKVIGPAMKSPHTKYAVCARMTPSIVSAMGKLDMDEVHATNKKLLDIFSRNAGRTITYNTNNGVKDAELKVQMPATFNTKRGRHKLEDDLSGSIINIPVSEIFFAPIRGSGKGAIALPKGSIVAHQVLAEPMYLEVSKGKIVKIETDDPVKEEFARRVASHEFDELAECGFGTNMHVSEVPVVERLYNNTILEKEGGTIHIGHGENWHFGTIPGEEGTIKRSHDDMMFPPGYCEAVLHAVSKDIILVRDGKTLP